MSKRLQKIREKWSDARLSTLPGIKKETSLLTSAAIFQAVVDADPTPNHKYVDWTLRTWETGAFQWEDIRSRQHSRVADQLKRFELNKHRILDPAMRSLLKYRSPGELDDIMDRHNVPALSVSSTNYDCNQNRSTYRRSVALGLGSLEDMENLKNNVITEDMVNRAEQRINTLFEMRNHHHAQDLISRCRNFDMDEDVSQNFDIDRDISRHLDKIEDAHMETIAILTGMRRDILKNEMTILDTSPSLR